MAAAKAIITPVAADPRVPSASFFRPGGALSRVLAGYEERPSQQALKFGILREFIDGTHQEPVPDVPAGIAVIGAPIVGIHRRAAEVGIRAYIESVRPGVTCTQLHSVPHALSD